MDVLYKICRECGESKPLVDYYTHKAMKDGHLNKCKICVRSRVNTHREKNIETIREYDLEGARNGRVKEIRLKYPLKYKARGYVANSLSSGKLIRPDSCSSCNKKCKPEAHHWSYEK